MNNELKMPEMVRIDEKILEDKGHGMYTGLEYWHEGKPFTGMVVYGYYPNGNIELEQEYRDGQTLGWEVEYHENGKVKSECFMYGATPLGLKEIDENGNVTYKGITVDMDFLRKAAREIGVDPDEIWVEK